jgi:hypothetical protein
VWSVAWASHSNPRSRFEQGAKRLALWVIEQGAKRLALWIIPQGVKRLAP